MRTIKTRKYFIHINLMYSFVKKKTMDKEIVVTSQENLRLLISQVVTETLKEFFSKDTKESDNRLLTRKEVCAILGISLPTLHSYTKSGTIKAVRIGNAIRYQSEEIKQALRSIKSIKYVRDKI